MNVNWCKQRLRSEVVSFWNRLFRVLHKTGKKPTVVNHVPYSYDGQRASSPFPDLWTCASLCPVLEISAQRGFLDPWGFFFVSTVGFLKPSACPKLKQNSRKDFWIKVGVFLAIGGMNMGVWINWWGVLGVSSETGPGRSFHGKLNIVVFAAHQCDKDQPKVASFFFFFFFAIANP